jgi:polyhydroxybutyrate depolymerase
VEDRRQCEATGAAGAYREEHKMHAHKHSAPALLWLAAILMTSTACAVQPQKTATGSFDWDGIKRTYNIHVPPSDGKSAPMPLVIALHGGGGSGDRMESLTLHGFNTLADREGFVVVYPDGVEKHWNDGRENTNYRAHRGNIDDVGFLSALIDRLAKDGTIDKDRVFVTGMSNGAMMSNRLACDATRHIRAMAPVAGNMPYDLAPQCTPSRPIPVLMISGTDDPLMPWEGGDVRFRHRTFGKALSVSGTIAFWVKHNRCASTPVTTWEPDTDAKDATRVRKQVYAGCEGGVEVILYTVEGGGHAWPGGHGYLPERFIGKTNRDIDANALIWGFFKKHSGK